MYLCTLSLLRPLLDYSLEWLLHNGLCEVILYLSSSPAKIKSWLASSRWRQDSDSRPLKITTIVNEDSASIGDACRDLDEKGVSVGRGWEQFYLTELLL